MRSANVLAYDNETDIPLVTDINKTALITVRQVKLPVDVHKQRKQDSRKVIQAAAHIELYSDIQKKRKHHDGGSDVAAKPALSAPSAKRHKSRMVISSDSEDHESPHLASAVQDGEDRVPPAVPSGSPAAHDSSSALGSDDDLFLPASLPSRHTRLPSPHQPMARPALPRVRPNTTTYPMGQPEDSALEPRHTHLRMGVHPAPEEWPSMGNHSGSRHPSDNVNQQLAPPINTASRPSAFPNISSVPTELLHRGTQFDAFNHQNLPREEFPSQAQPLETEFHRNFPTQTYPFPSLNQPLGIPGASHFVTPAYFDWDSFAVGD